MDVITYYLQGLSVTLALLASVVTLSLIISTGLTTVYLSRFTWLHRCVDAYIFIIRGTPLLVQLFILYYGLGQFDSIRNSTLWALIQHPFACALIALSLNTVAYTTVIFHGSIQRVPKGEVEAASVLGLNHMQRLKTVILPRALLIALPSYLNEIIYILKATALASTITLLDIVGVSNLMVAKTYEIAPFYLIAAGLYLVINTGLLALIKHIEKRFAIPA